MNNIIIQRLTTLEEVAVCDSLFRNYMRWLIEQLSSEHGIQFSIEQEETLHADFKEEWPSLLTTRGAVFLATVDGVPSGVCTLKPINAKEVELKRFYVSPACRGNGVGRQLIELTLEEARKMEYESVRLETFAFMKSAIKMYRSYGFEEVGPFEGFEGAEHGTGGVEVFMRLNI